MKVNGKEVSLIKEILLSDFLQRQNFALDKIAVEHNKCIVPKNQYNETVLKNEDVLEIVTFVGGG